MDIRSAQAREHHLCAAAADAQAALHRGERDRIVLQLRKEDPKKWTYQALANAVGCSRELIAVIVRQDRESAAFLP